MTAITVVKLSGYAYGAQQSFSDTKVTQNVTE